jgi:hypothetical protein
MMDSKEGFLNPDGQPVKRPDLLKWLCILSFIGSGLSGFSNLFVWLAYDQMDEIRAQFLFDLPEFDTLLSGGKRFFLSGFIFYSLSFFGVYRMWKLRKAGFHVYTGSQVFLLILPLVFIPSFPLSVLGLMITAGFIVGYAANLKYMT